MCGAANDAEKREVFKQFWEGGEPLAGEHGASGWLHSAGPSVAAPDAQGAPPRGAQLTAAMHIRLVLHTLSLDTANGWQPKDSEFAVRINSAG